MPKSRRGRPAAENGGEVSSPPRGARASRRGSCARGGGPKPRDPSRARTYQTTPARTWNRRRGRRLGPPEMSRTPRPLCRATRRLPGRFPFPPAPPPRRRCQSASRKTITFKKKCIHLFGDKDVILVLHIPSRPAPPFLISFTHSS